MCSFMGDEVAVGSERLRAGIARIAIHVADIVRILLRCRIALGPLAFLEGLV